MNKTTTKAKALTAGDLVMRVAQAEDGHVRFEVVSDCSKLAHWLTWKQADVTWSIVDATHTRVTWQLRYDRELDPAWYFGPWERYGVGKAAGYLIRSNAGPENE